MKSYRKELWFNIPTRRGFVNITPDVETCLHESEVREGLVLCNAMHISDGHLSTRTNTRPSSQLVGMSKATCPATGGPLCWRFVGPRQEVVAEATAVKIVQSGASDF